MATIKFSFVRDVAPIAGIIRSQLVVEVNPSFPAKSIPEFIAYAKANPGTVNVASAGNGSPQHVSSELFKMMTKTNMIHVPYRGEAPAITDLIGGHVQVMFGTVTTSLSIHQERQAACVSRDWPLSLSGAPRPSNGGGICAGL